MPKKIKWCRGSLPDTQNPDNILLGTVNIDNMYVYGASASLPFQLTDWLTLNANATYLYKGEKTRADAATDYSSMLMLSANAGVKLPKDFYFTLSYFFRSRVEQGELSFGAVNFLNAGLKKTFAGKRWTVSFDASNVLSAPLKLKMKSDAYSSCSRVGNPRSFSVSLTYNFNSGRMFQTKTIEKNADASRLSKDNGL